MRTALVNGRVLLPHGPAEGVCVVLEGGMIAAVATAPPGDARIADLAGRMLLPGFIDVQVNGGGGVLFNDSPDVATIAAIGAAHRRFGTTGFLPTLISDDPDKLAAAIAAVDAAIEAGVPGVLGIHLEGPFLNPARRGIHRADKLRALGESDIARITSARGGRTVVTLAPEMTSPRQIARLAEAGVIVAAGHSAADYDTARAAIAAGVRGATHLFNAMTPLETRAPGLVGAVLEDDALFAGVIADGHHVHPAALKIALKAKGAERLMLVTDAMSSAGHDGFEFALQGRTIRRDGDRLTDSHGVLAGSTLTMAAAFANIMRFTGASPAQAAQMASATPAAFLGLEHRMGRIAPGMQADLVVLDEGGAVTASWIAGQEQRFA